MSGLHASISAVVDLSHPLSTMTPCHPAANPPTVATVAEFARDGCFAGRWSLDEHTGTHVDAPAHFTVDGRSVDAIPAADLVLSAGLVDIRWRVRRSVDAVVEIDDILDWERVHGPLPSPGVVIALTGWAERIGARRAYLGLDADDRPHWPGFGAATADFLAAERPQVCALGIDTPSLDSATNERAGSAVHRSWLRGRRFGLENLTNLTRMPVAGGVVVVGVPAFVGGSGGPARVLGLIPTAPE
ncbi:cyclase family protein [Plantactinospora solaniradicis]|uniref:Cyclase family protein n=1 Tax=Plantactinospora solaniradicis TaxID=1723736 RepID=A0ABW1K585_9ACTN